MRCENEEFKESFASETKYLDLRAGIIRLGNYDRANAGILNPIVAHLGTGWHSTWMDVILLAKEVLSES